MKQEEKQLLLQDLCARLPYGICAELPNHHLVKHIYFIKGINTENGWTTGILECAGSKEVYSAKIEDIKPYLRPMSSMTEKECYELSNLVPSVCDAWKYIKTPIPLHVANLAQFDFFNSHHLDWRGLIPMGLAHEALEGMYNK